MSNLLLVSGQLVIAMVLGGLIGVERKTFGKPAGSRTFGLISLGSALFTIMSLQGFANNPVADPTRIPGQIIVGIGFICAGLIVLHRHQIEGLTTAAALWSTAAIGMAVGLGLYYLAIIATLLILLLLFIVGQFEFVKERKKTLWELLHQKSKKKWTL